MTQKDTKGKIQLNLVPPHGYEAIAKVRMFGNEKYGDPWGWLEACKEEDFIEAAKRHLNQLAKGEEFDDESGLPHLYHALCSLAMATELYTRSDQYHLQSTEINRNKILEAIEEIKKSRGDYK